MTKYYSDLDKKVSVSYYANNSDYPEQYFVNIAGYISDYVALEIGSRSDKGLPYVRSKSSGGYTEWKRILTNDDLNGHLYITPGGNVAIEAAANGSNTRYRLQLGTAGDVAIFRSTDGGKTWPDSKKIASYI
ncbi:hypothetical protein GPL15_20345 [Clostridium sp. MCC353]|uniref:hypothetical protein n=1 Tax=Clostridium sp. MCC353 TaxID=2592646 RepID=UPI001C018809|nr:hypothetical protein [Clostridium sp. MCC353]MBT9778833.1 hypothetical protein [Clostridium sp. MCC353]